MEKMTAAKALRTIGLGVVLALTLGPGAVIAQGWGSSSAPADPSKCKLGGSPEAVVPSCTQILNVSGTSQTAEVDALLARSSAYFSQAEYELSLADLERIEMLGALARHQTPESILSLKGSALVMLDRPAEGVEAFTVSIRLRDTSEARLGRGSAYLLLDMYDQAKDDLYSVAFSTVAHESLIYQANKLLSDTVQDPLPFEIPEDIIEVFYSFPEESGLDSENLYLMPDLQALMAQDEARSVPAIDFNPVVDGQDAKISDLQITAFNGQFEDQVARIVTARFRNFGEPKEVNYAFGPKDGVWKLGTVIIGDWNMLVELEAAAERSAALPSPSLPTGHVKTAKNPSQKLHECDVQAANKVDKNAIFPGVPWADIKPEIAIAACEQAVRNFPDTPRFLYQLGRAYHKAESYGLAMQFYRSAAEYGYTTAYNSIGILHEDGNGVEANSAVAYRWYEKAAEGGLQTAIVNVAKAYHAGELFEQDYKRAFDLFRTAALEGNETAMNYLGHYYMRGYGTDTDYEEAMRWYTASADRMNATGLYNVAIISDEPHYLGERDARTAAAALLLAHRHGSNAAKTAFDNNLQAWSEDTRYTVQRILSAEGFYEGAIDGKIGSGTLSAVEAFAAVKN